MLQLLIVLHELDGCDLSMCELVHLTGRAVVVAGLESGLARRLEPELRLILPQPLLLAVQ